MIMKIIMQVVCAFLWFWNGVAVWDLYMKKEYYKKAYIDIYLTQPNSTQIIGRMTFSDMTLDQLNQIMNSVVELVFYYTTWPESSFTVTGIITDDILELGRKQMTKEGNR